MSTVAVVERDDMAAVAVDTSAVALPVGLSRALDVVCDFMVNVVGVGALSITHRQIIMFYYLPEPETTKTTGTVLTTTGQVNGRWRILTPHRLETHELTATNSAQLITSARGPPKPNLVQIHQLGASRHMGEI